MALHTHCLVLEGKGIKYESKGHSLSLVRKRKTGVRSGVKLCLKERFQQIPGFTVVNTVDGQIWFSRLQFFHSGFGFGTKRSVGCSNVDVQEFQCILKGHHCFPPTALLEHGFGDFKRCCWRKALIGKYRVHAVGRHRYPVALVAT